MNTQERVDVALEAMRLARQHLDSGQTQPDPVKERRELARAASRLRTAANHLDDDGRLDPEWDKG